MASLRCLFTTFAAALLCGCGAHRESVPEDAATKDSFRLHVLPETFALGGTATVTAAARREGGQVVITISATAARGLKALYIDLGYDSSRYAPESAVALDGLGDVDKGLQLSVLSDPGSVHHGQVLVHPDLQAGLSGDAQLAEIRFAPRAAGPPPVRTASAPPTDDRSAATLDFPNLTTLLVWYYYSQGDYDENGETNVSDLTPLGQNFGATGGPFDPLTVQSVVDGDGNGEINLADITPIGQGFGLITDGYRLYRSMDEADYPTGPEAPNGPGAELVGSYPLEFDHIAGYRLLHALHDGELTGVEPNQYYWVRPYHGELEGTPSNIVVSPFNTPPVAQLTATPETVAIGEPVSFDSSASTDPEGQVLNYEWDPEGTGEFFTGTGTIPAYEYSFPFPGTYTARVRATDEGMLTSVATVEIVVTGTVSWHPQTLPSDAEDRGQYSCLYQWTSNNLPVISYFNATDSSIEIVMAEDALGAGWGDIASVVAIDDSGLALGPNDCRHGGFPGATYQRSDGLYFCVPVTQPNAPWGTPQLLLPGALGAGATFVPIGVRKGIAYLDDDSTSVQFLRANDNPGIAWTTPPVELDPEAGSALSTIALQRNGGDRVGIAYRTDAGLRYTYSNDWEASGAWTPLTAFPGSVGKTAVALVVSGSSAPWIPDGLSRPGIFFQNSDSGGLQFARGSDVLGAAWEAPVNVAGGQGADWISAAVWSGKPCVAFRDPAEATLYMVVAENPEASAWGPQILLDDGGDGPGGVEVGMHVSMIVSQGGIPMVAYYDNTNHRLKFASYHP